MSTKKFVIVDDQAGNQNIWMIENEDDYTYSICSRDTHKVINKSDCYKNNNYLYYNKVIDINRAFDFDSVSAECVGCIYGYACEDAFATFDCKFFYDGEDVIEEDRNVDMGYLEDYYLDGEELD